MSQRKSDTFRLWVIGTAVGAILLPFMYLLLLGPMQLVASNGTIAWQAAIYPVLRAREFAERRPRMAWGCYQEYLRWWEGVAGPLRGVDYDSPADPDSN